jgi:hypothetical protein
MSEETVDTETLKLAYDWWTGRVAAQRDDVRSATAQLEASIASAALILGLFAAFRNETDSILVSALFAGALLPLVAIATLGLIGPWIVQYRYETHAAEKYGGIRSLRFIRTVRGEEHTSLQHAITGEPFSKEWRASVAAAINRGGVVRGEAEALLSQNDWLALHIDELARTSIAWRSALGRAQWCQFGATVLLVLEVVYLVLVTTVAPFIS